MAAIDTNPAVPRQTPTPPPDAPHLSLETSRSAATPIPNKHLPYCPPGPPRSHQNAPSTPPDTPPTKEPCLNAFAVLHPARTYPKTIEQPAVFAIRPPTLEAALEEIASDSAPDPRHIFPWLHGLHDDNHMQLAFFSARWGSHRETPRCLRGLTIVKAGGDLSRSRLKGAISPSEILDLFHGQEATFLDLDPREGFSVRNFQIQTAKMATVSDIVVYRDADTSVTALHNLARKIATAQAAWRTSVGFAEDEKAPKYNTFIVNEPFEEIERTCPRLVAIHSDATLSNDALDFAQLERYEMCRMGRASEIAHNVWLGPTPESHLSVSDDEEPIAFDILIEASDISTPADPQDLKRVGEESYSSPQVMDFPSSGSILPQTWSKAERDPLTRMCHWMHRLANSDRDLDGSDDELSEDADGDIHMRNLAPTGRKILLHCTDGYTETTLLALAYLMFANQIPVHEAWLRLHRDRKRDFFAYPSDVSLLQSLEPRLAFTLYARGQRDRKQAKAAAPQWLSIMDGSLPSRILPYLYLGNLGHANNPELLQELGIGQVLSVGEPISWTSAQRNKWGRRIEDSVLHVDRIQDNGVDALNGEFERCLAFIAQGRENGIATLVHCRVGVSRSATVCIAEVMNSQGLSFPRAYCLVRARRLNVIIQPHLRFTYELMKYDEVCQQRRGESIQREMEWPSLCREIAAMNRPYCSK